MDEVRLVKISKYLSKHLRHQPERLGITLEPGGWTPVVGLLDACAKNGLRLTRPELDEVVAGNNKQRFSFDQSGTRIRANQGHSVEIDLQLSAVTPPGILYHGTSESAVGAIMREGLRKMRRHHVHLSVDIETATGVGARHGRPVVFAVDSAGMAADGLEFFRSANGVWLTESVPPRYLTRVQPDAGR